MKRGKNTSVKWKMVGMILLYWALPFALLLLLVGHVMADRRRPDWNVWLHSLRWITRTVLSGLTAQSVIRGRLHMTKRCMDTMTNSAKAA